MSVPFSNKSGDDGRPFGPNVSGAEITAVSAGLEKYFPAGPALEFRAPGPELVEIEGQDGTARLEAGPTGRFGLSWGRPPNYLRLASAIDPEAEDRALVERAGLDPARGVLCCGLGLGHYLEELDRRLEEGAPVWVLEAKPELAAAALLRPGLRELLSRPRFRLFIGPFHAPPWGAETRPPQTLWRPAALRNFSADYKTALPEEPRPPLRPRPIRRLLLFQGGYFLDRELKNAAAELGLETAVWNFQRRAESDAAEFKELLNLVKNFHPQMMLTVNHLGFDAEGILDGVLTDLKIPVASWFVDSPVFILKNHRPGPLVSAFAWDSDYLDYLKDSGFQRVQHLPLAADANFFHPLPKLEAQRPAAFVGDSLEAATAKFMARLGFASPDQSPPDFLAALDRAAEDFLKGPELLPRTPQLGELSARFKLDSAPDSQSDLAALITWRASRLRRLEVLTAFPANTLTVAGDRAWAGLLKNPAACRPPLAYYDELNVFYQGSRVNLNVTSAQMKGGLNQRVFDVPAGGAFLLTDERRQLAELFEPGREVIVYQSPEEAADLAGWFGRRDSARAAVSSAARRRILDQHLYRHRLKVMLDVMAG